MVRWKPARRDTRALALARFGAALFLGVRCCMAANGETAMDAGVGAKGRTTVSLAGTWRFQLDPRSEGVHKAWHRTMLPFRIGLPGTTDEHGYGTPNEARETEHLSRQVTYTGAAWYQRDIEVPEAWRGKRLTLFLERSRTTRVWVDGQDFGSQDSTSAPHVYDLTAALSPGWHVLTVCVDNSLKVPIGGSHAVSEHTQTNWNGIVGRIELRATAPVWIDAVQVYPDVKGKKATVRVIIGNRTGSPQRGRLTLRARGRNGEQAHEPPPKSCGFTVLKDTVTGDVDLPLGEGALLWDEFSPAMYRLTVSLSCAEGGGCEDEAQVDFGMREFARKGTQFAVNGKVVFLRGKHDACVFPLTGYAPMDVAAWERVLTIARSYGINHYRFHSWCPPDAAFAAADRVGIYMQPELPNGASFGRAAHDAYMAAEGERILDAYGNHPSFVMFALGNELGGNAGVMEATVRRFRERDPRRLYAQGSNNFFQRPGLRRGDDYWTTFRTKAGGKPVRGSFSHADPPPGHVEARPPSTLADYRDSIAGVPVPVIGHEVGQYQVFPSFREIDKYTGVLRPRNLEAFRERLAAKGMLERADDFLRASGALAVVCYREEIEAALRTPGFGGFQLLDLQDFPGQGTALVGILDAFMDSKGLIEPAAWREFCSAVVPLLRMPKYCWTQDETFAAEVQVANYGPAPLPKALLAWSVTDAAGKAVASGKLPPVDVPQGGVHALGKLSVSLAGVGAPAKLIVELRLGDGQAANHYGLWVYPKAVDVTPPAGVAVRRMFDARTRAILADGGRVLLLPEIEKLPLSLEGAFQPDFWCYPMFKSICERKRLPVAPGTLGILCDPKHPALARFPTEFHGNWQWWHLVRNARPVVLDDAPPACRPIVQVIDNVERSHKLGLLFETSVGEGKLLVCSADLTGKLKDHVAARQFLHSLLAYAASEQFRPAAELPEEILAKLLPGDVDVARGKPATAAGSQRGRSPGHGNDGRPNTRWCAPDGKTGYWWQVDLGRPHLVGGCEIRWEFDGRRYGYRVDGSEDGKKWALLADRTASEKTTQVQREYFEPKAARHVRLTATSLRHGGFFSFFECKVFGEAVP